MRPFISCLSFSLECSSEKRHLTQEMCCCSSIISMIVRYHPDKSGSSTLLLLKELNSSSVSSEVLRPSCHGCDCRAGSPRPLPTGQHPPTRNPSADSCCVLPPDRNFCRGPLGLDGFWHILFKCFRKAYYSAAVIYGWITIFRVKEGLGCGEGSWCVCASVMERQSEGKLESVGEGRSSHCL